VTVDSEGAGRGTTFTVRLPVNAPTPDASRAAEAAELAQ
jgi:hypothetical protein